MGLINLTNLEDGQFASANQINQRFGTVVDTINGNIEGVNIKNGSITQQKLANNTLERMWPVGSVYINASDDTNPGTTIGFGTWEVFATGRMLLGVDESDTDFNAVGKTGGAKTVALTEAQNGRHRHSVDPPNTSTSSNSHSHNISSILDNLGGGSTNNALTSYPGANIRIVSNKSTSSHSHSHSVNIPAFNSAYSGNGEAHDNMSPWVTVYMWRRTS